MPAEPSHIRRATYLRNEASRAGRAQAATDSSTNLQHPFTSSHVSRKRAPSQLMGKDICTQGTEETGEGHTSETWTKRVEGRSKVCGTVSGQLGACSPLPLSPRPVPSRPPAAAASLQRCRAGGCRLETVEPVWLLLGLVQT